MLLPYYPTLLSSILGKISLPSLVCLDEGLGPARTHYSTARPRPKPSPLPKTRVERVTGYRHRLMDWWKNLKVMGIGNDIFVNTFPVSSSACVRWVYLYNGEQWRWKIVLSSSPSSFRPPSSSSSSPPPHKHK